MRQRRGWRIATRAAVLGGAMAMLVPTVVSSDDGDHTTDVIRAARPGPARNVILLIGDGLGDSETTIARNYLVGAGGRLALDTLPLTGQMTTYSLQEADPARPDYVPDSASTSTAWSTGQKTSDGRISTRPQSDTDIPTILDEAERAGMPTGVVTTSELTDATPAGPMSHVRSRRCQGPVDMAACPNDARSAGGPGSIAEQSIDHGVDVLLGGGRGRYEQTIPAGPGAGGTVVDYAKAKGYSYVTDREGLLSDPGAQVLGLFTPGNMTPEFSGAKATNPPTAQTCATGQRPSNEPSLAEMTDTAIKLLSPTRGRRGFFLQVESASIDKRDHAAEPCQQIGETKNFDEAVRVALEFAERDPRTLVIQTADHAHTSQIVEVGSTPPGLSSILTTADGAQMQVTYGTGTPSNAGSQQHTGSQVRVAAKGPQAANVVGLIDQTEMFGIMRRALSF